MSSDDDLMYDAFEHQPPLPSGSTGTPNERARSTPSPQQQSTPSTAQTDFASSEYRQNQSRARRNPSSDLNQSDNLVRLDAQGRLVDSRGQVISVVSSSSKAAVVAPNRRAGQLLTTRDTSQNQSRARRNLSRELDRADNLLRLDAQGRIVDSRGQLVQVAKQRGITSPPTQRVVTPVSTAEYLFDANPAMLLFKHVVAPVAKFTGRRVVAPAAKATFRHAVVPAAKAAVNMAANALSPPGAPVSQAVVGIGPFGTSLPPVRPGAGPAVGTVTPLIADAVRTTSAALGRTASRALAALPPAVDIRDEDDNPANVIGTTSTKDMPPRRGSDVRPEVARRELQQLYEQHAPAKLAANPDLIDDLLDKYRGRYDELLKMVRLKRSQTLSTAASDPADEPDEPDATPQKPPPTVTSAQIEAGPPSLSASPAYSAPPATPVRHTSRNGSTLVHADSNASFQSTVSHGEPRGLARLSSRPGPDGPDRTISAPVRPGDFQEPVAPRGPDGPDRTISAPVRPGDFQEPVAPQIPPAVVNQQASAAAANPTTATAAATTQNTLSSASSGMNAVASAARAAEGASPETLVSLYEELQRNPQLKQLVAAGLLSWSDLLSDKQETLPDGTKARVVDAKKLLALQQRLSTLAQKEAGKLQNIQEVAVQQRTVPGLKAATPGAIYPGVSVFMYPRELPAGRPGA